MNNKVNIAFILFTALSCTSASAILSESGEFRETLSPADLSEGALMRAIRGPDTEKIRLLLSFVVQNPHYANDIFAPVDGVTPFDQAKTALQYAAQAGNEGLVRKLLDTAIEHPHLANQILAFTPNGLTAVFFAADNGHAKILRILLESPFRVQLLNDNHINRLLGDDPERNENCSPFKFRNVTNLGEIYRILLTFAPRLQGLSGDFASLWSLRIGDMERFVFATDLRLLTCLNNEEPLDPELLKEMLENATSLNPAEYLNFADALESHLKKGGLTQFETNQLNLIITTLRSYFLKEQIAKKNRACARNNDDDGSGNFVAEPRAKRLCSGTSSDDDDSSANFASKAPAKRFCRGTSSDDDDDPAN